jgi:hypothetical protein
VENVVRKIGRSPEDAAAVKKSLVESFPFLTQHCSILDSLSRWHEWYVGIVADDVDPADYDSFSLSPLEELYWRTEWKEVGFFTIAMFFVKEVETNVVISTLPDSNLYLWKRDDSSQPVVCRMTLEQILDGVEQNPTKIDEFLIHVTKGTRMPDPE